MKFKIAAGAEMDIMTEQEARKVIEDSRRSWVAEISRGVGFPRFHGQAQVRQDGSLTIGGSSDPFNTLGPAEGFCWDVRRLRIRGHQAADEIGLYIGDMNPSQLVSTTKDVVGSLFTFETSLILQSGEELVIGATGGLTTAGGTYVTVSGAVREVPTSLMWRLGSGA